LFGLLKSISGDQWKLDQEIKETGENYFLAPIFCHIDTPPTGALIF